MADHSALCEKVKNAVVVSLKHDPQAHLKVGALVLEMMQAEMKKPGATTKFVLEEVCLGAMHGLLLAEHDLAAGAVEILKALVHLIQERSGDPMTTMGYALEGIARIAPVVSGHALSDIGGHIEAAFTGAGQEFGALVDKHSKKA
ncbi:MAG: hypothetical protein HY927_15525 [Elusimicrobia bacterium]|nr:hypothetical protein [Elusimicrobiota bacterium]